MVGRINSLTGLVAAVAILAPLSASPSLAASGVDTTALRAAVTVDGVRAHQAALQAIADDNGGTRVAGSPGYDKSAEYVKVLLDSAGYFVTEQSFSFVSFQVLGPSTLDQVAPNGIAYVESTDFDVMSYSDAGNVTAAVTPVDVDFGAAGDGFGNGSTSGCEVEDFIGFQVGNIALIQRGACTFQLKAENAVAAGAAVVIIFNQGDTEDRKGLISGTLSAEFSGAIPVLEATFDLGKDLAETEDLTLHIFTNVQRETLETRNVIAETVGGRADRVVVVGAHLDSVPEGPGIQDNGSGSAAILEIALQMAALQVEPRNKVRFAWWSAEESGLIGSQYYVDSLSRRDIKNIAVNLNFDMIGSPNFVRFIYDGDGSATGTAGPNGSKVIEDVFQAYFDEAGLPTEPTAFDGRSDYGPFIDVGIPAGGLFTGAEEIKTDEEAAIYGGTAGDQLDPCYHLACDVYANTSEPVLDEMSDAAAHAILSFAMTTSAVNGTDKGKAKGQDGDALPFLGSHARR